MNERERFILAKDKIIKTKDTEIAKLQDMLNSYTLKLAEISHDN